MLVKSYRNKINLLWFEVHHNPAHSLCHSLDTGLNTFKVNFTVTTRDSSLTILPPDTTDLRNFRLHFHVNEKTRPWTHVLHTPATSNHCSRDLDWAPPLLQHCWERHLVSTGAKLHFYSCPRVQRAAFDQDPPEQMNWSWRLPQLKIILVLFFYWIWFLCKISICLSKHWVLCTAYASKICGLVQIRDIRVVVSCVFRIYTDP